MPQIKRGNETISIRRRKDLALLIYLVVTSQPHSRDTLSTLLWQEEGQAIARSNLRKSLSRLRALLGENSLLVSQDQIRIHPDLDFHLDIKDFYARLKQARKHHNDRNGPSQLLCSACRKALEEAAELYQADFLHGFPLPDSSTFEEWQFFQAESLRQNLAQTLEQLTQHYISEGNFAAAITYCRRWLALDKLHEPAQRQLILLYALNGQWAAAKRQFEECVRLLEEELHTQPEPETLQLFDAIQKKKLAGLQKETFLSSRAKIKKGSEPSYELPEKKNSTLPTYPSPFIGREKELEDITRLLRDPSCRLLSLLGPGGSGKTRLALQAATQISQSSDHPFADGIYFISLAPLTDPDGIVGALIGGLKIIGQARGVSPREKLLGYLQGRRILLVLDNFEHLLGDVSITLISELMSVASQSRILVTSRERLNLQGEQVFRVDGLEIPGEWTLLTKPEADSVFPAFSALQLFAQCAVRVQPSFKITRENYEPIVQICRMVQGMPLAIEMAASWLEIFSPKEIRGELDRSLDFLQTNLRDLPDRQRSLRAVFDSSWGLLEKQTRPILKALSVFRAGFTREAAQSVAGASAKTLLDLTNKSWLQRLSSGRYQIHELLRQFCYEKLQQEIITFDQVRKQYCEYYATYASSLWSLMKGKDQKYAFSSVGEEIENLHTACTWLGERKQIGTAVENILPPVYYYTELRETNLNLFQVIESAREVLKEYEDTHERRRWEIAMGAAESMPTRFSVYETIRFGVAGPSLEYIWSLLEQEGSLYEVDYWTIRLAYAYGSFVDEEAGIRYLKEAMPKLQDANRSWELATALLCLARLQIPRLSYSSDNDAEIERYIHEALNIFTALGDELNISYALLQFGFLRLKQERLDEAIEQWKLARAALNHLEEWSVANNIIRLMGDAYLQLGQFEAGFKCFDSIAQICFEHGHVQQAVGALSKESFEMVRHGNLEDARRIREQCIELIESTGPEYQIGWNYWEMGEVLRVMGKLGESAAWFERARKAFEAFPEDVSKTFYYRGIGDIALANGDFPTSYQYFQQSAELALATRHDWAAAYALNGLGKSKLGMHKNEDAKVHMIEALQYALKAADRGILLVILEGYTEYLYKAGDLDMAVQLGSLVSSHYATWNETKAQVAGILASLKKSMTVAQFKQAQNQGQLADIWETVGNLIAQQNHQTR